MSIDLNKFTPEQLGELIAQAEQQRRKLHRDRIGEVRKKLTAMAKAEGYTVEQLFGTGKAMGPRTGTKVAPKYRNPANANQTWSGRGKRPRWLADALAKGGKIDSYRI